MVRDEAQTTRVSILNLYQGMVEVSLIFVVYFLRCCSSEVIVTPPKLYRNEYSHHYKYRW